MVVDSLEVALWGFYHYSDFEEGLLAVVNLGGDADTIVAIYGQLVGAYWGKESIANHLILGITHSELINRILTDLCKY